MTFGEAHDLMDLLLDKADQPYFTVEEKDKFLNLAYFDWFDKALDRYDSDPEIATCLAKLIHTTEGRFEDNSRISFHTRLGGAQSVPYRQPSTPPEEAAYGVPINSLRSISRFPFARLLHLQVNYVNQETGDEDRVFVPKYEGNNYMSLPELAWREANLVKSNEHGLLPPKEGVMSDTNSDPFNKANDNNVKCYMQATSFQVFPTVLENGKSLSGWRNTKSDGAFVGWENAGRWRARYISYPIASAVANGDAEFESGNQVGSPDTWGTRNVQMGSYTYFQQVDIGSFALEYTNSPVASLNWGWPMHICNEIVQNAVRLMTSNIEGANYQTQAIEAEQSKSV